jgi:ABC-2 type transport system ATP-binding protein
MTTIELQRVTRAYGSALALDDVTLAIGPGITALLGPNGAGKSTLIELLCTAAAPTTGAVTVLGHAADGSLAERTAIRRQLGYLPQEVDYPSSITAFGFLEYLAVLKEIDDPEERRAEIRRTLELVGLDDRPTIKVKKLSGGQRRRLGLAQALLGDPALLVLDEPTTGLDPEQRAVFRSVVTARAPGTCVVLATHQTADVEAICDAVVVLDGGRVRFVGDVPAFIATAEGQVTVDEAEAPGAIASWRDATGSIRSIGGQPGPASTSAAPTVEDAYLLLVGPSSVVAR